MFWYQSQLVCVKWGNVVSNFFRISTGVWQGVILLPKQFALYMNNLSRLLVMSNVGCYIDGQCMNHLMYADDIFLLTPTAIAMQQLLDICDDYGVANDITFNSLKSVCLVFRPAKYKLFCPHVHIGNAQPEFVYAAKYLGFMICENKNNYCDMLRQLRTLYVKSNKIIRTFSHCTIDVKLLLIRSYCTSFHCGYMWSDYKKTTYSKLRVALNKVYRRILGLSYRSSASTMYTTHNINNMEALLRRSIYSFIERLIDSSNMIINTLMNSWYIRFNIWEF